MIDLHFTGTPNGHKVAIMLEETGLKYRVRLYDLFEGEHLTSEFAQINPNHKIPAIVDHDPAGGGPPHNVFESGAILLYLAEKTGRFLPSDARGRSTATQWLIWQMASMGPMMGQFGHFKRYAPDGLDYAVQRYAKEATRLLHVLANRLQASRHVGGDDYSIADMAIWPWAGVGLGAGLVDADDPSFRGMRDWMQRVEERPAVQLVSGREDLKLPEKYKGAKQLLSEREWSNVFGENQQAAVLAKA